MNKINKIFSKCQKEHFMLGAFNVFNYDTLLAVLDAAEAEHSPVIIQTSLGARKYHTSADCWVAILAQICAESRVPVILHHDHCKTFEDCKWAIDHGMESVMFDGSHLPLKDNIQQTAAVVEYAHERGCWVEAELGSLPGFEDTVFSDKSIFTDSKQATQFVRDSGCDSLAIAVGTSHGGVASDHALPLHLDVLREIKAVLGDFPLVLHGGASLEKALIDGINAEGAAVPYMRNVSEPDIALCRYEGIVKVNMDVDNFMAYTTEIRRRLREFPDRYDPRTYLKPAREAFEAQVRHKMRNVLYSSGKAD